MKKGERNDNGNSKPACNVGNGLQLTSGIDINQNNNKNSSQTAQNIYPNSSQTNQNINANSSKTNQNITTNSSQTNNNKPCAICMSASGSTQTGRPDCCEHLFCVDCLTKWSENSNTCPIDRKMFRRIVLTNEANTEPELFDSIDVPNNCLMTHCQICRTDDITKFFTICTGCRNVLHRECRGAGLVDSVTANNSEWLCPVCDVVEETPSRARDRRRRTLVNTVMNSISGRELMNYGMLHVAVGADADIQIITRSRGGRVSAPVTRSQTRNRRLSRSPLFTVARPIRQRGGRRHAESDGNEADTESEPSTSTGRGRSRSRASSSRRPTRDRSSYQ